MPSAFGSAELAACDSAALVRPRTLARCELVLVRDVGARGGGVRGAGVRGTGVRGALALGELRAGAGSDGRSAGLRFDRPPGSGCLLAGTSPPPSALAPFPGLAGPAAAATSWIGSVPSLACSGSAAGARSRAFSSSIFPGCSGLPAGARLPTGARLRALAARPLEPAELPEPERLLVRARSSDSAKPSTVGSAPSLSAAFGRLRAGAAGIVSNSLVKAIFVSPVTPTANSGGSCASRWQACLRVLPAPPRCRPGPRVRSRRMSHQRGFGGSGTEPRRR